MAQQLMRQLLETSDEEEATLSVMNNFNVGSMAHFCHVAIVVALKADAAAAIEQTRSFLHKLLESNCLLQFQFRTGLHLATRQPNGDAHFTDRLAELLVPMFMDRVLSLTILRALASSSRSAEAKEKEAWPAKLSASILHGLISASNHHVAAKMWQDSRLSWSLFMEEDEVAAFLSNNQLDFSLFDLRCLSSFGCPADAADAKTVAGNPQWLLAKRHVANDEIIHGVSHQIRQRPLEICGLAMSIAQCAIQVLGCRSPFELSQQSYKERLPVLAHFVRHSVSLRIKVLCTLQGLVNGIGHPYGNNLKMCLEIVARDGGDPQT